MRLLVCDTSNSNCSAGIFEDGKEILFYQTDDELIQKARYYSGEATDSELQRMKKAARERAEKDHSWWNRFSTVFDTMGLRY